jgi:alanyl-tRNA synthetase
MTPKKAVDNGALALFGEKYGEEVRVLSMGNEQDKYFSTELCGGTHVRNTRDIGKFKIINQSSIAAGVRRVEALRDKQLQNYLKNRDKQSGEVKEKNEQIKNDLIKKIKALKGKPHLNKEKNQSDIIRELNKQYEQLLVASILENKTKNIIKDISVNDTKVRFQKVQELPFKDLRSLIDKGKKELNNGVIVVYAIKDNKIGLAVGVTQELSKKIDAVNLVKIGSEIIGGKGGGGRADFAQAGGSIVEKIEESFERIKSLIN